MGIGSKAATGQKKERRKKPDELLSSVVRETAIPAAVELLRANTPFALPSQTAWVMLSLEAEDIGGLNAKQRKDAAKGSIIELINDDIIQTVATVDMLAEEAFGIIPTEQTIERMEEFSLLKNARYSWAVVWQDPSGDLNVGLVSDATFAQAKAVSTGSMTLREAIGDAAWELHSGEVVESAPAEPGIEQIAAVEDEGYEVDPLFAEGDAPEDDQPVYDEIPSDEPAFDEPAVDESEYEEAAYEESAEVAVEADPVPVVDEVDDGCGEPYGDADATTPALGDEVPEQVLPAVEPTPLPVEPIPLAQSADEVNDSIARRFLREDLDIDVDLAEFEKSFGIGEKIAQIGIPEGATQWLGDQIAHLNRQANAELLQMRLRHEDELRAMFVSLMGKHADQVLMTVDVTREGSRYKELMDTALSEHRQRQNERKDRLNKRRNEIVEKFDEEAKLVAEKAARQEEVRYRERNRSRLERLQADAAVEIDRELENRLSEDRQEILRLRRQDAEVKMESGVSAVFQILAETQSQQLEREEKLLVSWRERIEQVVADNRQADIAQAEALTEYNARVDEIARLRAEHDQRMESMQNEHAEKVRRMEEELDRARTDAATQMQVRDEQWQHSLSLEKEKTSSQTARNEDLVKQLEQADARAEQRYKARLSELLADKESWANTMARADAEHARSSKILVVFMIALGLVCGAAGWVGGIASGLG